MKPAPKFEMDQVKLEKSIAQMVYEKMRPSIEHFNDATDRYMSESSARVKKMDKLTIYVYIVIVVVYIAIFIQSFKAK